MGNLGIAYIPAITAGPLLFPRSFTLYLISAPYGCLPRTEDIGLTVFRIENRVG